MALKPLDPRFRRDDESGVALPPGDSTGIARQQVASHRAEDDLATRDMALKPLDPRFRGDDESG